MLGKSLALAVAAVAGFGMAHAEQPAPTGRASRIPKNRRAHLRSYYGVFDDTPRYYPGAKLARKASDGKIGIARIR